MTVAPSCDAELHRGQAHPAARAEHDQLVAGAARAPPSAARGSAVRWATPNAAAVRSSTPSGIRRQPGGGHDDLLGERAEQPGAGDPVADGETR